MPMLDLRTALK